MVLCPCLAVLAGSTLVGLGVCGCGPSGRTGSDYPAADDSPEDGSAEISPDDASADDSPEDGSAEISPDDASADDSSDDASADDSSPDPPRPVEYLGYFASAFDGHGTGDHTAETAAAGANLTFIQTTVEGLAAKLATARDSGCRAVLVVQPQLFDWSSGLALRSDWRAGWEAVAAIVEDGYADTVVAFYPLDEPYWNAWSRGVADDTMRTWLTDVAAVIHERFPTKAVGTILAVPTLQRGLGSSYVAMFDWVGFDCYGPWDDCMGGSMPSYVSTLASWLTADQRMIVVPEAFLWGTSGTGLLAQNMVVERLNLWHKLLLSDSRFIAAVPFLWPTLDLNADGLADTGARDLPWIRERVSQLAESLLRPGQSRVFPADYDASSFYSTSVPFAAADRDEGTAWNSGGMPPQWLAFDLGEERVLARIELLTTQDPAGSTTHLLEGAVVEGSWFTLGSLAGVTRDNQLLEWTGSAAVRWVRVTTSVSPSWVGWREIRFFQ